MTTKCKKIYGDILDQGTFDYGFTDKQGRKVGYKWDIRAIEYIAYDNSEGPFSYYEHEIGSFIQLWGTPTRDGYSYGPSSNRNEFRTLEEARRHAVKRVEDARKRDTKKFGKEVAA